MRIASTQVNNFGYLFLTDIDSLFTPGKSYADFESREPGYSKALLSAYNFAFNATIDKRITAEFIRDVHRSALQHMPHKTPGICKNSPNFFPLGFPTACIDNQIVQAANPTATASGFWQFVDTWMIKERNPIHFIHICFRNAQGRELYFLPVDPTKDASIGAGPCIQVIENRRLVMKRKFDVTVKSMIDEWMFSMPTDVFVNSTANDMVNYFGYRTNDIQGVVMSHLDKICDQYNDEIEKTITDREKIAVIVKYAQRVVQLHPFSDGNSRTAYILLNRLLHEEKLPLTLLINPNRLDCYSTQELVDIVEEGQERYLYFLQEKTMVANNNTLQPTPLYASHKDIEQFAEIIQRNVDAMHRYYLVGVDKNIQDDAYHYEPVSQTTTSKKLESSTGVSFSNFLRPNMFVDTYHFCADTENPDEMVASLGGKAVYAYATFFKEKKAVCVPRINSLEVAEKIRAFQ